MSGDGRLAAEMNQRSSFFFCSDIFAILLYFYLLFFFFFLNQFNLLSFKKCDALVSIFICYDLSKILKHHFKTKKKTKTNF